MSENFNKIFPNFNFSPQNRALLRRRNLCARTRDRDAVRDNSATVPDLERRHIDRVLSERRAEIPQSLHQKLEEFLYLIEISVDASHEISLTSHDFSLKFPLHPSSLL